MVEPTKVSREQFANTLRQTLIDAGSLAAIRDHAAIYALEKVRDNCLEYGQLYDWLFTNDTEYRPHIQRMWSGQAVAALDIAESVQLMIDLMEET